MTNKELVKLVEEKLQRVSELESLAEDMKLVLQDILDGEACFRKQRKGCDCIYCTITAILTDARRIGL